MLLVKTFWSHEPSAHQALSDLSYCVFAFSFGAPWIRSAIFPCFFSSVCSVFGRQSIDKDSSLKWPIICSWGQTPLTRSFTHSRCQTARCMLVLVFDLCCYFISSLFRTKCRNSVKIQRRHKYTKWIKQNKK